MHLTDRLREFMKVHGLRRYELAGILQTPLGTVKHWLQDDVTPPACLLTLMDILEQSAEARRIAGVKE